MFEHLQTVHINEATLVRQNKTIRQSACCQFVTECGHVGVYVQSSCDNLAINCDELAEIATLLLFTLTTYI